MKDLVNKSRKDLQAMLSEKRVALKDFRFAVAGSNTRNVKEGNDLKKDIAQILTAMNIKPVEDK